MATLNTSQMFEGDVQVFEDDGVTPATLPAGVVPVWATSDATAVTVETDATGLHYKVKAGNPNPTTPARVTVNAVLPDGKQIAGVSDDITVTQDPATEAGVFKIVFGAPVAKA